MRLQDWSHPNKRQGTAFPNDIDLQAVAAGTPCCLQTPRNRAVGRTVSCTPTQYPRALLYHPISARAHTTTIAYQPWANDAGRSRRTAHASAKTPPTLRISPDAQLTATAALRLSTLLQRPWMASGTCLGRLRASILLHLLERRCEARLAEACLTNRDCLSVQSTSDCSALCSVVIPQPASKSLWIGLNERRRPARAHPRGFKCHALPQTKLRYFSRAPVLLHNLAFSHCQRGWSWCTPSILPLLLVPEPGSPEKGDRILRQPYLAALNQTIDVGPIAAGPGLP